MHDTGLSREREDQTCYNNIESTRLHSGHYEDSDSHKASSISMYCNVPQAWECPLWIRQATDRFVGLYVRLGDKLDNGLPRLLHKRKLCERTCIGRGGESRHQSSLVKCTDVGARAGGRACAELQSWPASQPATDCAELWRVVEGGGGNLAALTLAGWLAGWV